ncbi:unnamed protein product [Orchesella dallaii]|uniref:Uncharacterized protein n=1 Tax=Orchesella dallaii TaxID=48710 RepID=A0ABP1S2S0_9HEXA
MEQYQKGSVGDYYFVEPDTLVSNVIKLLRISDSVEDEKLEEGRMQMKYLAGRCLAIGRDGRKTH